MAGSVGLVRGVVGGGTTPSALALGYSSTQQTPTATSVKVYGEEGECVSVGGVECPPRPPAPPAHPPPEVAVRHLEGHPQGVQGCPRALPAAKLDGWELCEFAPHYPHQLDGKFGLCQFLKFQTEKEMSNL